MSLILASSTDTHLTRDAEFTLRMLIEDEEGDAYDLTGTTPILRLARSYTDEYSVLQLSGSTVGDPVDGRVNFEFTPAMTSELNLGAYDFDIWVGDYPAYRGRIGVEASLPEVST